MSIDIEYQAARTVWASRILGYVCQKIPQDRLSHVDNDSESEEDELLDKDDLEGLEFVSRLSSPYTVAMYGC